MHLLFLLVWNKYNMLTYFSDNVIKKCPFVIRRRICRRKLVFKLPELPPLSQHSISFMANYFLAHAKSNTHKKKQLFFKKYRDWTEKKWKPSLTSIPWHSLNIDYDIYFIKRKFTQDSYELLVTEMSNFWYEEMSITR